MPKRMIAFGIVGFLSAVIVDLNAYSKNDDKKFDVKLAVQRWIAGFAMGCTASLADGE